MIEESKQTAKLQQSQIAESKKELSEEEKNIQKLNDTLNDTIAFLTPDQIHLTDELPKVINKDKTAPTLQYLVDNQLNTLISQLNIQEIVFLMGSKLFTKYMTEIQNKYDKSNIGMLKNALKTSEAFANILKDVKNDAILQKCYGRYVEKIKKSNDKKDARKQARIVNKLAAQKKKQVTGCLMQKVDVKDYEDCITRSGKNDAKYASSFLSKDEIIDELIREKMSDRDNMGHPRLHDEQVKALAYDVYKKKSEVALPTGKLKYLKDNPGLGDDITIRENKIKEMKDKYKKNQEKEIEDKKKTEDLEQGKKIIEDQNK